MLALDSNIRPLVETVWNYHQLHHPLSKADVILVLCSHDTIVAERGAEVYLQGWAPLLVFSGGLGAITRKIWNEPEAELFARIAIERGVPKDRILIENKSTNTGENVQFSRQLLAERGIDPRKFILVQKPYMERRTFATFKKNWPEKELIVTSPQMSMEEYLSRYSNGALKLDDIISIMVGDLQRIRLYPAKGFQIPQEIPGDVWDAFSALVQAGYGKHLVKD